jgi:hypothetical protein
MASLANQNISESFGQLLKTAGSSVDGNLQNITGGNDTATALQLSTTGVKSTGSFGVDGASTLTGLVTFGTSLTASTGTATIGTLSVGTATISTATIPSVTLSTATISTASISTATIPLQLGEVTFGSSVTASTGTATIGTLSASTATISTATISTATIPLQLGTVTFGSSITASSGTATLGTIVATSETVTNSTVSNRITSGTYRVGAAGPSVTNMCYGTASFPSTVVGPYNASGTSTGTFGVTGAQLGDFVCGSINSIGSATGAAGFYAIPSFYVISADVVRWAISGPATTGTIGAGIVSATAWRMTA